eukprot:CAMPEP_0175059830 /NCGR_PEP_ID=MMETSP0052_2-20121109/12651_1 /TAXON_ID=51329 ORGANISM="Polytomella parva, Strain SAG 63-3" /NCGR_SAMPLE_ID=MMETSP0052_2 /ASSEMBLY_ACC=CAM_ASM_000194 /LENGTH=907 /DNA_ID=CAMNT_0016325425 /DNA_START=242 /DNA_END=2965 /DNA_ORIENTATION=-
MISQKYGVDKELPTTVSQKRYDVSPEELDNFLHNILQGSRVWEWVAHGVGFPQYADTFRVNSITPLDLPILISNNGALLSSELGITSVLHREKLVAGIKRLILAYGKPPGEPQNFSCSWGSGGPVLTWNDPSDVGQPPFHKYIAERLDDKTGQWVTVADTHEAIAVDSSFISSITSSSLEKKVLSSTGYAITFNALEPRYRVMAWNAQGRSAKVEVTCKSASHFYHHAQSSMDRASNIVRSTSASSFSVLPNDSGVSSGSNIGQVLNSDTPYVNETPTPNSPADTFSSWETQENRRARVQSDRSSMSSLLLMLFPWVLRLIPLKYLLQIRRVNLSRVSLLAFLALTLRFARHYITNFLAYVFSNIPWTKNAIALRSTATASVSASNGSKSLVNSMGGQKHSIGKGSGHKTPHRSVNSTSGAALQKDSNIHLNLKKSLPPLPPANGVNNQHHRNYLNYSSSFGSSNDANSNDANNGASNATTALHNNTSGTTTDTTTSSSTTVNNSQSTVLPCTGSSSVLHSHSTSNLASDTSSKKLADGSLQTGLEMSHSSRQRLTSSSSSNSLKPSISLISSDGSRHSHRDRSSDLSTRRSVERIDALTPSTSLSSHPNLSGKAGVLMHASTGATPGGDKSSRHHSRQPSDPSNLNTARAALSTSQSVESITSAHLMSMGHHRGGSQRRLFCGYPGCDKKLDMLHYKDYKQKHYCGRCQQMMCLEHTAYSPHGPTGGCGYESRCTCVLCFLRFSSDYQAFLMQRNTLLPYQQRQQLMDASVTFNGIVSRSASSRASKETVVATAALSNSGSGSTGSALPIPGNLQGEALKGGNDESGVKNAINSGNGVDSSNISKSKHIATTSSYRSSPLLEGPASAPSSPSSFHRGHLSTLNVDGSTAPNAMVDEEDVGNFLILT